MPSIESGALAWVLAACLGFWVFLGQSQEVFAGAGYRGEWGISENDEGRLLQIYQHHLGINLGQSLTERFTAREKVSYSNRWAQGSPARESVSPGGELLLSGDIFDASLAVDSVITLDDPQSSRVGTDRLGAAWASRWEKRLVPQFRAAYDYSRSTFDFGDRQREDSNDTLGGEVNWDLLLAQLFYSYRRQGDTRVAAESSHETHLASIRAQRSWLANRLVVALGHSYTESTNERRISFISSETVALPLNLSEIRTGTDALPEDIDESTLSPAFFGLLQDGDRLVAAYSVVAPSSNNTLLLAANGERIDRVYLYTASNLGADPLGLQWGLYSNDALGTTWNPEGAPAVTYDTTNQRFVLDLPATLNASYLKVVVGLGAAAPPAIGFTEVVAEQLLHGTVGTITSSVTTEDSARSNFSVDFRLNPAVSFFYAFFTQESARDAVTTNELESHNGGVRLQNGSGDLKSTFSGSLARGKTANRPETEQTAYQLSVKKVFLPTLSMALSGHHEESAEAGKALSVGDRYSLYADARLYPDLNSRLEFLYWENEQYLADGGSSLSDSLSAKFNLTSRFRPSLTVTFSSAYEVNSKDGNTTLKKNTAALIANWQLSEWLMVSGSASRLERKLASDAYNYSAAMTLGLAAGMEFRVSYALQTAETLSQSGSAALRASANKNLTWEIGCNYAESEAGTEQNVYTLHSMVQLSFATR